MEYKPGSRIQAEDRPCGRALELPNTSNEGPVSTKFVFFTPVWLTVHTYLPKTVNSLYNIWSSILISMSSHWADSLCLDPKSLAMF